MIGEPVKERLVVDSKPVKIRIESDVYLTYIRKTFVPVLDVLEIRSKREYYIICSAQSLCEPLYILQKANNDSLKDCEIWIYKDSDEKSSKYKIEIA